MESWHWKTFHGSLNEHLDIYGSEAIRKIIFLQKTRKKRAFQRKEDCYMFQLTFTPNNFNSCPLWCLHSMDSWCWKPSCRNLNENLDIYEPDVIWTIYLIRRQGKKSLYQRNEDSYIFQLTFISNNFLTIAFYSVYILWIAGVEKPSMGV